MEKNHFASKGLSIFALVTIISIAWLQLYPVLSSTVPSSRRKRIRQATRCPYPHNYRSYHTWHKCQCGRAAHPGAVDVLVGRSRFDRVCNQLLFNLFLAPEHLLSGDEGAFLPRWLPDTYVILLAHSVPPLALIAMTETLANSVQAIATLYRKREPSVDGAHIDDRSALEALEQANQVRIARAKNRKARALKLSSEGKSLGDIASDLNLSKKQVRNYLKEGE